jgi:hypothetical protein
MFGREANGPGPLFGPNHMAPVPPFGLQYRSAGVTRATSPDQSTGGSAAVSDHPNDPKYDLSCWRFETDRHVSCPVEEAVMMSHRWID